MQPKKGKETLVLQADVVQDGGKEENERVFPLGNETMNSTKKVIKLVPVGGRVNVKN